MHLPGNDGLKKFTKKNTKSHVYNKATAMRNDCRSQESKNIYSEQQKPGGPGRRLPENSGPAGSFRHNMWMRRDQKEKNVVLGEKWSVWGYRIEYEKLKDTLGLSLPMPAGGRGEPLSLLSRCHHRSSAESSYSPQKCLP